MAKKYFIIWILLCSFSTAIAQNFVPIKIVSGFNADVIANGVGPVSSSTTHTFDTDAYTLVSRDFVAQEGNTALTFGLPTDGRIIATYDPRLIFQLNPYSQNNSLRLEGSVRSGDLVFQTPENATRIVILTAAGNAIGSRARFSGEIRFTDNTNQFFYDLSVEDWYSRGGSAPTVTYGMGRISFLHNLLEFSRDFPRLFGVHIDLPFSNYYKKISSIHVFKTSSTAEVLNIMAVTVKKTPDCFEPTNIQVNNISRNQATISWDAAIVAPNLGYEYEIRTSGVAGSGNSGLVASGAVSTSTILQDITNLISSTEYFVYVRSKCTATSFSDWSLFKRFETKCLTPTVVATGDVSCQPAALNLTATVTNGITNWYSSPTSENVLHTGETYTTPVLSESKYYYVEGASPNFVSGRSGKDSLHSTANNTNTYYYRGITFDLANDVLLKSTDVFASSSGTLNLVIYDATGTELFSTGDITVSTLAPGVPVAIPLNFQLMAGTGYRLLIKSFDGIDLYRDSNVSFPYRDSSEILTVTSSWSNGSPNPDYYYFFYNLAFERGCRSPRQAVLATVYNNLAPSTSLPIQTFCFDAGTQLKDLSVDGSNIKWYDAATGGNPWSETDLVTDGVTYYASQTYNGCESMDRLAITTKLERIHVFSVNQSIDYNYKDVVAALSATPAPGNKILWYLTASAVDGDETAPIPSTDAVGIQKFWVRELSPLGCISDAVEITVTVNPVELTVTADSDLRKVFGASDPVLTYTASGFVGLDGNSLFTGLLDRISGELAGSYAITQGTLNAGPNYTIRFIANLFTIEKAPLTGIVFDGKTVTYDGTTKSLVLTGLPTGATVTYINNDQIDAGTHTVTATINGGTNYEDATLTAVLTIEKAVLSGITFDSQTVVYDGEVKSLVLNGLPTGATVTYINNDQIDAGTYTVTATIHGGTNYEDTIHTAVLIIEKAVLSGIVFNDQTVAYDGTIKSLVLTGLPMEATVIYTNNDHIDAGTYTVTATINGGANYENTIQTAVLTIEKAVLSGIVFNDQMVTYDGRTKSLVLTGLPAGATVNYSNNDHIDAGTYTVTATINGGTNYENTTQTAVLTIKKAVLSSIVFDNQTVTYDGTTKSLVLTGLPMGAAVTYINNDHIDAGTYTVTATINGGTNYENTTQTAVLTIEKAPLTGIMFDGKTVTYDGTTKSLILTGLPTGATVTYINNDQIDAGTYTVTATINGGTNYENTTQTAVLTIEKATIPTRLFNDAVFVYDGFPKSIFIENALPIGVTVSYTNNGQIAAGTYTVTANIHGGTNFQDATVSASMTIQKAQITNISFSSVTIPYDGTVKSIYISGTLPATTIVTYQNNGQINLGTYPIVATIVGGNNYEDLVLNATLTIEKGVLSNVYLPNATYTYDGQQKSLQIAGSALPPGVTVSYVNNGHTDAGTYTVRAAINGGANYHDRVLQSLLIIKRAPIENVTFSNATFTYDTTIKSLAVSGTLGAGVTVSYKNNAHVNAGVYTVTANIDGGKNYNYLQLTAQLIIEKASQFIDFKELDVVTLEDSVDFQLAAKADSGLAVSYTYTFTTETAAASVSESGWVIPKQPGSILVTAQQGGNHNYLQAPSVTRELRIVSRDASIHELWIGSQHYIAPPEQIHYIMDCDDLKTKVKVVIQAQVGATMDPGQEFVIDIIKPGMHTQTIRITSENGAVTKEYQIIIEKPFPFHAIVQQKYNHVLMVNNNPKTNGGFKFVKFEWYKNDQLIGEEQVYSSGNKATDVLDTKAIYRAVLTSSTGQVLTVCPSYIELKNNVVFRLHPNPVEVGARIILTISDAEFITIGAPLRIYDMRGRLVQQGVMEGHNTEVQLSSSVQSGVYLAVFKVKGQDKVIKFVVK